MEFNSQICTTREQSENLLALGLKRETADMCWLDHALTEDYDDWRPSPIYKDWEDWQKDGILAWSLHRLMILLDMGVEFNGRQLNMAYNDLIMFIEYKISIGRFNKDYLEETL